MTLIYPATADAFRCIADACRHTCCKGWEIDIDPDTRAKYAAMTGEIGQRLRDAIADTPDGASFRLREDERCPMLNDSGLCDIITAWAKGRCAKSVLTIRATATSFRHSPKLASGSAAKRRRI